MRPPHAPRLFFDGRHYDQKWCNLTADLPFWLSQARKFGAPILELACGTGRVALHLARSGFRVTGIDISDSMLAEARKKATQEGLEVEWVKGDIRQFDLARQFPLIIFPFNTICILYELEELEACLGCVKKHLRAGGRFIVHLFNPRFELLLRSPMQRYPHAEYPDPDGNGTVVVTESNVYDSARQINRVRLYYALPGKPEEVVEELNIRIYFPQEIDALLKYNGFEIEAKYGDDDESPFGPSSPRQLIICKIRD